MFRGVVHELGLSVDFFYLLGCLRRRLAMPRAKVPRLTAFASPLFRWPRNLARTTPKWLGQGINLEHGCICIPRVVASRALKMPEGVVLHFFRYQIFLLQLAQVVRVMVKVRAHTRQPPMPLRGGPEFNTFHLKGKQPLSMRLAMQLSEMARK